MNDVVSNLSDFVGKLLSVFSLVFSGMYIAFLVWAHYHDLFVQASQEATIDNPGKKDDSQARKESKMILLFFWMLLPMIASSGIKEIFPGIADFNLFKYCSLVYTLGIFFYFIVLIYITKVKDELKENRENNKDKK